MSQQHPRGEFSHGAFFGGAGARPVMLKLSTISLNIFPAYSFYIHNI